MKKAAPDDASANVMRNADSDNTAPQGNSAGASGRRVLMMCYFFPPIISSGVTRSLEFAKLLPEFGWQPLVLTVNKSKDPWVNASQGGNTGEICVQRTSEWNLAGLADFLHGASSRVARLLGWRLSSNFFREYFCVPDSQIAWFSTYSARKLASKVDLIYVSCSPFSSSVSAAIVKRLTGVPLVVDFRDALSLNPHSNPSRIQLAIAGRLERFVLGSCDALIVNTDGAERLYASAYPEFRGKISTIPNGYDVLTPVTREFTEGDFVIMHVGSFYGARNPDALLECLAQLNRDDILFVQIGGEFESYENFKGRVRIKIVPPVPREKALELMKEASLLYIKQGWEPGVTNYIAVAAKTYEYLATGLPILAEVPPGDNADLVKKYASPGYVVTSNRLEDLRDAIEIAYREKASNVLAISPEFATKFSRQYLARQVATLFDKVVSH